MLSCLYRAFFRRRRNLLTFSEMTKFYLVIVFYIHLESIVFLLMYNFQDSIGPDNVFYAVHTLYAVFDLIIVVCVVFVALTGDLFHFSG